MVMEMKLQKSEGKNNVSGLTVLIGLAVLIILVSAVILIAYNFEDPEEVDSKNRLPELAEAGFRAEPVISRMLYPMGDGLLKVGRNRISILDLEGKEVTGQTVDMTNPICHVSGNRAVIADTESAFLMIIDDKRNFITVDLPSPAQFVFINREGYVLYIFEEEGTKGIARFLTHEGNTVFTWKSILSGYIVSGAVSPDSLYVDLNIINTDGAIIQPLLRRFGSDGEQISQYLPDLHEIFPIILYDNSGDPVICGKSGIVAFGQGREKYSIIFDEIYTAQYSEYGILTVARKTRNDIPNLYMIDFDGDIHQMATIPQEPTEIAVNGIYAAVGYGNTVIGFLLGDNPHEISRNNVNASVLRVGFSQNSEMIITVAMDGVTIFPIK